MSLDNDFEEFRSSPEARIPIFDVPENWRELQYERALENGDIEADENPNLDFVKNWAEPEYYEAEEFEKERSFQTITRRSSDDPKPFTDSIDLSALRRYLEENPAS